MVSFAKIHIFFELEILLLFFIVKYFCSDGQSGIIAERDA
jgi:hypothetical protein